MQTLKELHAQAVAKHGVNAVKQKLQAFYKRLLKKPKQTPVQGLEVEILQHLNQVANTSWQLGNSAKTLITALLKAGYSLQDFKQVHASKASEWLQNPQMAKYLRPSTLYRPKNFVKYLEESKQIKGNNFAAQNTVKW